MPEYLTPGVYIEEIERGPRPIEGVPTSTAAFLGETERGPTRPRLVTSYNDYKRLFGGTFGSNKFMPYAVNGFFENGGKRLYVCRVVALNATTASRAFGDVTLRAVGPGAWGNGIFARITEGSTKDKNGNAVGFRLQMAYWSNPPQGFQPFDPFADRATLPRPTIVEDYDDLSSDKASPTFYEKRLGTGAEPISALAWLDGGDATPPPAPAQGDWELLSGGGGDDTAPDVDDFVGLTVPGQRDAPQGLEALNLD